MTSLGFSLIAIALAQIFLFPVIAVILLIIALIVSNDAIKVARTRKNAIRQAVDGLFETPENRNTVRFTIEKEVRRKEKIADIKREVEKLKGAIADVTESLKSPGIDVKQGKARRELLIELKKELENIEQASARVQQMEKTRVAPKATERG